MISNNDNNAKQKIEHLTHRLDPNRYDHSESEWNWELL